MIVLMINKLITSSDIQQILRFLVILTKNNSLELLDLSIYLTHFSRV